MYEVEVKARLEDRGAVIKKLEAFGCKFGKELHQVDHIFIEDGVGFPPPLGLPVLRIRKQNEKYILTLKIPQGSRQDCIEKETEIVNGEEMLQLLKLMKWNHIVTVDKKRIKTNYKDMEIVLDVVEHLGEFIEAEKIVKDESKEARKKIQEELFSFLETIGVSKDSRVIDGKYDIMVYEKLKGK